MDVAMFSHMMVGGLTATHRSRCVTILAPTFVAITGVARMLLNSSAIFKGSTISTYGAYID